MADFTQSFSQGVETGANLSSRAQAQKIQRRQLEAQERRQAILEPMEIKAMEQQNVLNSIKIKQGELEREFHLRREVAFTEVSGIISQAKDLADPALERHVLSKLTNVTGASNDSRTKVILDTLRGAQKLKQQASKGPSRAATLQEASRISQLTSIIDNPNTTLEERKSATVERDYIISSQGSGGYSFTEVVNPDGTTTRTFGPAQKPTTGDAMARSRQFRAEDAINAIDSLDPLITADTTGLKGGANRLAATIYGQFPNVFSKQLEDPNIALSERYKSAAMAAELKIIQMMKIDSVMSEAERKKWETITPGIQLSDNEFKIRNRLFELKKSAVDTIRVLAAQRQTPIPIKAMTPMELAVEFDSGRIDKETLRNVMISIPFDGQEKANAAQWVSDRMMKRQPIAPANPIKRTKSGDILIP